MSERFDLGDFEWRVHDILRQVLSIMPNRELWEIRFRDEPGLEMRRDDDGWITVLHRGDSVFRFNAAVLEPDAETGEASAMVDGREEFIDLVVIPRSEMDE